MLLAGARDTTVELMDAFFSNVGGFGCQVVDRTGIQANIDFSIELHASQGAAARVQPMGRPACQAPAS